VRIWHFGYKEMIAHAVFVFTSVTSDRSRDIILDHHNEVRNNVEKDIGVAASNIMKMVIL